MEESVHPLVISWGMMNVSSLEDEERSFMNPWLA